METNDKAKKNKTDYEALMSQGAFYLYKFFWVLIIVVMALLLLAAYQYFLLPKYDSIASNAQINQKRQEYIDRLNYYRQLSDLQKAYEKIKKDDIAKINDIVTNGKNQNDLYREVEYIVKKNGLKLDSIEPTTLDKSYALPNLGGLDRASSPLLGSMQVVQTVCKIGDVSYEGLLKVIKTFEVNLRIMDISKVEYDPTDRKATLYFLTYQFQL